MKTDTTNIQQQTAYKLINDTNANFFLTGKAGTGKTTFLKRIQEEIDKTFIVVAPTGIAAINAGGETIHSFFGLPLGVLTKDIIGKVNSQKIDIIKHTDTIIIDEVSMCRCDIIDAIDRTLRHVCHNGLPFGGKQMVFVGDIYQLPPVITSADKGVLFSLYGDCGCYFFDAKVFGGRKPLAIEFMKVYRQEDADFLSVLNHIRQNCCTDDDLALLNTRVAECNDKMAVTLCTLNAEADKINRAELDKLGTKIFSYTASVEKDFDKKRFPVEETLQLKVGAQVMTCRNDPARRWVNGSIGIVTDLKDNMIEVEFENGQKHLITKATWDNCTYTYDKKQKKTEKQIKGTYTQYPIRLAWAITVHKSQGLTFEKMKLNMGRSFFQAGQLYVALSRVTSMEGLYLSAPVKLNDIKDAQEIRDFASGFNDENRLKEEYDFSSLLYGFTRKGQYDEAAKRCLALIADDVKANSTLAAIRKVGVLLKTVIDDRGLMHMTSDVPLLTDTSVCANFTNAVISLYGDRYQEAIDYADRVLQVKGECAEALYVKARAYAELGNWDKADQMNATMAVKLGKFDAKLYFSAARVNEYHTQDSGLEAMQNVVIAVPSYTGAVCGMRELMKRKHLSLEQDSETPNSLIDAFNSDMTADHLRAVLEKAQEEDKEQYTNLVSAVRNHNF